MGLRDGVKSGHTYVLPKLPPEYRFLYEKLPAKYLQTELKLKNELSVQSPSVEENPTQQEPAPSVLYPKATLISLKNTGLFESGLINHIFEGVVNEKRKSKGKNRKKLVVEATGFHSECIKNHAGKIIEGTRSKPDSHGVYTGLVSINGVAKKKPGTSTFFPRIWKPQQIVNAINEAYKNKVKAGEREYVGTSHGIKIKIWIGSNGKIASAYPIKED